MVYNAIQDLWKIASREFANKSVVDMEDNDWSELIDARYILSYYNPAICILSILIIVKILY